MIRKTITISASKIISFEMQADGALVFVVQAHEQAVIDALQGAIAKLAPHFKLDVQSVIIKPTGVFNG